ncbi:aldo/keto reductase [Microbispora hainanensis]|uniref:aldo/keto reductase n=1 Tax=Microbispora hainanensis TaxID=568844 RepID=UPI0033F2A076
MTARSAGLAGRLGRYGLGTAPLGGLFAPVSEQQAEQTLTAAWQAGIRYFDTAPHYGSGPAEATTVPEELWRALDAAP